MTGTTPAHPWDRRLGFWWIAEDHPDAPAVLAGPDGPLTYAELAARAHQLVHLFRHLGAGPDAPVAVMADNGNTLLEASLACHESGLHMIPLNTHLSAHELEAILRHSQAGVLLLGARFAALLDDVDLSGLDVTVLAIGEAEGLTSLADARAPHPTTEPADRRQGGLFVYTSGTTGHPKGIRRPLAQGDVGELANAAAVFGRAFDFRPFEGPMLVSTGMFHGGSHAYYMGGLNVGHALVVMDRFDAERTLATIEEHRVRTGYMVPTQFHRLLQLPDDVRRRYDLSSLHSIVHSAAPCPRVVKEQMLAWWGPVIWETYGGMEGAATIAKPAAWLEHPGTVGRAVRGVRLSILDDDGNELPPGEVGNIYVDNGVGFAYHDDPEQTAAAFRGRRFSLGDVGYLDEDGFLFIADRAKDMIITGGTNVYPAEVEGVLLDHPAVHDAGVIGVPDPDWGETVAAVVQLVGDRVPDAGVEAELEAHCRTRLASYKVPRRWFFADDLPRTEAGKLAKRALRERFVPAER
ncbi:AMP-binding protein [Dermatobacter hominis]|uniref:AMP-binding protein n=1 Tax=Dermatobacter hominis TaxID=2884263 RepID=UPI001D11DDF2|nr:AMP-binding protein [Dermatobacter hominis]UDY36679.1 AMP-binding protein [Dermatobacter hominis]